MPPPTDEQTAVIEAGAQPLLVVAGAGSGKTETMAARVVWLVANGLVDPDQVLGLTFTRKAAAELSQRIAKRLRGLERAGLWTPPADDGTGAEVLGGTPTVSTYHAYAGRLVREHALRVGIEPEFRVLTEAGAWQLAAEAVSRWDGPMDDVVKSEATVIQAVMALAGEMAEHVRTPAEVMEHLDAVLARLDGLPDGEGKGSLVAAREAVTVLRERRTVLPIVEAFLALKRERESLDFADQMAIAARLTRSMPAVGEIERQRFRAVLLDEFQDTSEAQLELLRSLFHHPGVALTAVGDPNQSIYGWRGASATTLLRFPAEFAGPDGAADVLPLSTSWRNDLLILDAANAVAAPLATAHVQPLRPRPGAEPGSIDVARLETAEDEADHVAAWIAAHWFSPSGRRTGRSAAVLCRRRSSFPMVLEALRRRRLPVEVVGLGGLLVTPEVSDLVAALWVVQDPTRGDQLMRLLTGPVVRLGAADLAGLWAWARELHGRPTRSGASPVAAREATGETDATLASGTGETEVTLRTVADGKPGTTEPGEPAVADRRGSDLAADSADTATLVEALDELPRPGWVGRDGSRIGDEALSRLRALGDVVRRLRRLTALPLVDLVAEAEVAIGLDIEVLARPEHTALHRPGAPRCLRRRGCALCHVGRPADPLGLPQLARRGPRPGARARRRPRRVRCRRRAGADRPRSQGPRMGRRGGAHPGGGCLPGSRRSHLGRARHRQRPGRLRLHRGRQGQGLAHRSRLAALRPAGRPRRTAPPRLARRHRPQGAERRDRGLPARRGSARRRRGAAAGLRGADPRPLRDVADHTPLGRCEEDPVGAVALPGRGRERPPRSGHPDELVPGTRAGRRRRGQGLRARPTRTWQCRSPSLAARPDGSAASRPERGPQSHRVARQVGARLCRQRDPRVDDLRLLLAEQAARRSRAEPVVDVPRHLSASAVVSLARDVEAFAMSLRRPMPSPPAVAARQGTAFHTWIEEHYSRAAFVDLLDLPGSADEGAADDGDLEGMKERFLASEWADRIPEEIELSIETVIDEIAVRGRVDAVFARDDGGWTVVDWKTGARPVGRDAAVRALQLAAYAVAFARLRGVDPSRVDAAFYYAADGITVRPDLPREAELVDLLRTLPE